MKSIIQNKKECYVCHTTQGLHEHHIFFGSANRKKSEANGLKVYLCGRHHNLSSEGVHFNHDLDLELKQTAQRKFEENHTRQEFMNLFHKNYL